MSKMCWCSALEATARKRSSENGQWKNYVLDTLLKTGLVFLLRVISKGIVLCLLSTHNDSKQVLFLSIIE